MTGRVLAFIALGAAGCGPVLPPPRPCPSDDGRTAAVVSSPPPPGGVEIVPPAPKDFKHPVWVDGEQEWSGRRWVWKPGGWRDQAPDECYARPVTQRLADGRIVHVPGLWKKDDHAR
jgi:hypothetical protein